MILQALAVRSRDGVVPRADSARTAAALLLASLLLAGAATAQAPAPPTSKTPPLAADAPAVADARPRADAPVVVVPPTELEGGWLELTPLEDPAPPVVYALESQPRQLELWPPLPEGRALLCSGDAVRWGTSCEEVALVGGLPVFVGFAPGTPVTGVYRSGDFVLPGAEVAVVPVGIAALRPFTAPLGRSPDAADRGRLRRRVVTDDAGRFRLPALAVGDYFLETLVPGGRLHRSERFFVPPGRLPTPDGGELPPIDLGEIDVADGLEVEVRALDDQGEPVAGVDVRAFQGHQPGEVAVFAAVTGRDGVAVIRGFALEPPTRLRCERRGRVRWEASFEAVPPARVDCPMVATAMVGGEVLLGGVGLDPEPPDLESPARDASLTVTASDGRRRHEAIAAGGRFEVVDLAPGDYQLVAAAPGYQAERRSLSLAAGEKLDLGTLVLLPGRQLEGRVVDGESGEPLGGVEVLSTQPPGAVVEVTDEDGEFVVSDPGAVPLKLVFVAPDHAERRLELAPERFATGEPLVVELARGGWIRVVVRDRDFPCFDCRVVIQPGDRPLWTDLEGEARSPALAPGGYRVLRPRARHLGSTVVEEPEAEAAAAWVEVGKTTTVRFGDSPSRLRVVVEPTPSPGSQLVARRGDHEDAAFAEPDGSYLLARRSGAAELVLRGFDPRSATSSAVRVGTLPEPERIDREPWRLELPRTAVTGQVTSAGAPVAGAPVRLLSFVDFAVWATTATDREGRFAVRQVVPGVYAILIGGATLQHVALADGRPVELGTYSLPRGGF